MAEEEEKRQDLLDWAYLIKDVVYENDSRVETTVECAMAPNGYVNLCEVGNDFMFDLFFDFTN